MAIHLVTLGGLQAVDDDSGELDWLLGQHSRAALFVYLAIEGRVSRETLTTVFWPESDAENARHALRQSLYHLRKAVGSEWVDSRAHELVVTGDVRTDAHAFTNAIERHDRIAAVGLYRGPFLDGVHLVDLQAWESWVDGRRAQYARTFRKACRELLDARRTGADFTGAIEIAEQWAARDPTDGEAQYRLIEALADAGERAEAIRQYEAHRRALEPDGLQPLDETVALAERLRSESRPLPSLRAAATAAPLSEPVVESQAIAALADDVAGVRPAMDSRSSAVGRSLRLLLPVAAVVTLLVAIVLGLRRRQVEPTAVSSATIAVLPFQVRGGEAVAYLREGMVTLLGTALDGAGSLRPADTRATFAAVADAGGVTADARQGNRIATRLGAGMYVLGDVVEAGGQLQIDAAVYHAGGGCGSPGRVNALAECAASEPMARAVVTGTADSVFTLVDKLAARLLGGLGHAAADRLVQTASLTTASLPAFKAYLQGEELMRAGQFERAADSYQAAITQDSTFAVAHYRLGLAREWAPLPGEDYAAAAAARHGARLSSRDRSLLEAFRQWRAGDATGAEGAYRAILARYPDDLDAWFQLGEILFHHGPLLGRPIRESEEAWRKVLAYEPRNLFAVTHLARMAILDGRAAAVDSLLEPFGPDELRTDRRLAEIELLRAVASGDTAAAHAMAKDVRRWEPFAVWRVAVFLTAFNSDPAIMRGIIADLIDGLPSPAQRADLQWFASLLDLALGESNAARVALAAAGASERQVPVERRRWGFAQTTEWFAATLPLPYADSLLLRVRNGATTARVSATSPKPPFETEMGIGTPIQIEPLRQYTLGTLSVRLRDTVAAVAAAAKLQQLAASDDATVLTRDLDRGLRARLAWLHGRPADALQLLEAIESRDSQGDINTIPFVSRANERYLRGEVLVSLGRDAEALRWFESLGDGSVTEIPLRALSHLRQAEIHDRLNHHAQAAPHLSRFLELWRNADPGFRQLADSVRRRTS